MWSTVKKYFRFENNEISSIVIGAIVIAFIVSFRDWGIDKFDPYMGISSLLKAFVFSIVMLLIYISIKKLFALNIGINIKYKISLYGLIAALILCIITNGYLWILIVGIVDFFYIKGARLGFFRYGPNVMNLASISLIGQFSLLFISIILKIFSYAFPGALKLMYIALAFSVTNMLPIPKFDGMNVFYASRLLYVFSFVSIIAFALLLSFTGIWYSIFFGLIIGLIIWWVYMAFIEKELG